MSWASVVRLRERRRSVLGTSKFGLGSREAGWGTDGLGSWAGAGSDDALGMQTTRIISPHGLVVRDPVGIYKHRAIEASPAIIHRGRDRLFGERHPSFLARTSLESLLAPCPASTTSHCSSNESTE